MKFVCYLLLLMFFTSTVATAACPTSPEFWKTDKQGRGWFWKEECEDVEIIDNQSRIDEPKYKLLQETQSIPWDIIDKIDPDEIAKVIEPTARKVAITYPTTENITEYRKLSLWMTNKTVNFAKQDEKTRTNNPNELMAGLMNSSTSGHFANDRILSIQIETKRKELERYAKVAGILVFVSPTCDYCKKQIPVLDSFKQTYGFTYVATDISQKLDLVEKLQIETTPDIFLAINRNGEVKYQRIATGLHSFADLENAVLKGLIYMGEIIDEKAIY